MLEELGPLDYTSGNSGVLGDGRLSSRVFHRAVQY